MIYEPGQLIKLIKISLNFGAQQQSQQSLP